jgi:predicted ester cyclase
MNVGALARRFYDEIWNLPDLSVIPEVLGPDLTFRGSLGPELRGHDAFADYVRSVTAALGSYRCDIVDLVTDGETAAAARMTFSGIHRGEFLGHPPTGRRVSWAGAAFFHADGGLVRDLWVLGDLQGLSTQLDGR